MRAITLFLRGRTVLAFTHNIFIGIAILCRQIPSTESKQSMNLLRVLLLLLEGSTALQIGNHNRRKRSIYYTSAKTKCESARTMTLVQTEYSQIADVYHESSNLQSPLLFDFQREDQSNFSVTRANEPVKYQEQPSRKSLVNLGCIFALNSGFMNGMSLSGALGKAASTSAVTGTYTNAAVAYLSAIPKGNGIIALLTVLATPTFYMLGSMVNGLWIPEGTMDMAHLSFTQTAPLLLAGSTVLLARLMMKSGAFAALSCLAFTMGLQNSWTSMILQGNLLRSAHFSGITSDFGTVLGQMIRGNNANAFKLPIFAKLTASFWLGGMLSVGAVQQWNIAPSLCCTLSALLYFGFGTGLQESTRLAIATVVQNVQTSIHQRYRTFLGLCHFWWKESQVRHTWDLVPLMAGLCQ